MKQFLLFMLAISCNLIASAQITTTGVVSDEFNSLTDAHIYIKGNDQGTITDKNGRFKMETKLNDTLVISHLGYATKEIKLVNRKPISILLEPNISLDEVLILAYPIISCNTTIKCQTSIRNCSCRCSLAGSKIERIETLSAEENKLYPNPSSEGVFNLKLNEEYNNLQIQVVTISGQIIKSEAYQNKTKQFQVDLSSYPKGIYVINIFSEGKKITSKKAIRG